MKTVFTNAQVAIRWAAGDTTHGRNGDSTLSFANGLLFSYSFTIAKVAIAPSGERIALVTPQRPSVTSSAHISRAKTAAARAGIPIVEAPAGAWHDPMAIYAHLLGEVADRQQAARRARGNPCWHLQSADNAAEKARWFAKAHRLRVKPFHPTEAHIESERILARIKRRDALAAKKAEAAAQARCAINVALWLEHGDADHSNPPWYEAKHRLQALPAEVQRAVEEKKARLVAEATDNWRRTGGRWPHRLPRPMLLRIDGKSLETSGGAKVRVSSAKALLRKIVAQRKAGVGAEFASRFDRFPLNIDGHRVDLIRADGSVVVGCHDVPWSEIERIARELGIETA